MKTYRLSLMSPLYYRSGRDSGASGSTYTAPWVGDLALMYAINNSLGLVNIKFGYLSHKPNYSEIRKLGMMLSVARAEDEIIYTRTFDIATSFLSEGYSQTKLIKDSGRAPMRNWLKRKGIEAGNIFYFSSFFEKEDGSLPEKFTIRIGNTKECLAYCEEVSNKHGENLTLNLFTLNLLLGEKRLKEAVEELIEKDRNRPTERPTPQYVLVNNVPRKSALSLLSPYR